MTDRIVAMPRASVIEDDTLVELEFQAESGKRTTLQFDPDGFDGFLARANELVIDARNRKLSKGDHLAIHPLQGVAATAESAVGGGRVLLSVRASNGIFHHFAISPDVAEELRPQLHRAAKSARKQASQHRH